MQYKFGNISFYIYACLNPDILGLSIPKLSPVALNYPRYSSSKEMTAKVY